MRPSGGGRWRYGWCSWDGRYPGGCAGYRPGAYCLARMSLLARIMDLKAGQPQWTMEASGMKDHNGVLMMQRVLLAGTLGLAMARKAAAILGGDPAHPAPASSPSV